MSWAATSLAAGISVSTVQIETAAMPGPSGHYGGIYYGDYAFNAPMASETRCAYSGAAFFNWALWSDADVRSAILRLVGIRLVGADR